MAIKYIDGKRLRRMFLAGSYWLAEHTEYLNELNVYPVPDGDTGTNMSMTVKAIEDELRKAADSDDVDKIAKIISNAAILGARGNSGTILSQILYGFLKGLLGKEKIRVKEVAEALTIAKETAYKAVRNPVEGTILTIIRRVAEEAEKCARETDDLIELTVHIKKVAHEEVERTIEMLPKLKEAGVVDAGAKGFYYILEGFEKFIKEGEIARNVQETVMERSSETFFEKVGMEDIKYHYCTEFIIENAAFDIEKFETEIEAFGDSAIVAASEDKVKVHIHTNNPGLVLEYALNQGELSRIKIDNMSIQHTNKIMEMQGNAENQAPQANIRNEIVTGKVKSGYVAVADTREMAEIFILAGAEVVIVGGQTNNPSVGDIGEAVSLIEGKDIVILPNNKNVIPAAKMVIGMNERNIHVAETKAMLEGYYYLKNKEKPENIIEALMSENVSIEITKAIRTTKTAGLEIKNGDFVAIINGNLEFASGDLEKLIKNIMYYYVTPFSEKIDAFVGKNKLNIGEILNKYSYGVECDIKQGNQDHSLCYIYMENKMVKNKNVAIVTDSVCDLPPEWIKEMPVFVVPLRVSFGGEYMRENIDITKKQFWQMIKTSEVVPKTSTPPPADFLEMYRKVFKLGYKKIISLHAASNKSGVVQAAMSAKNIYEKGDDIKILDSTWLTLAEGHLVIEAAKLAKEGREIDEIFNYIEKIKKDGMICFYAESLKYLQKGGRISKTASYVGGILHLVPIIKMHNSEIFSDKKTIGKKNAMKYIKSIVENEAKKGKIVVYNFWGNVDKKEEEIKELREFESKIKNIVRIEEFHVGAVIGAHTGQGVGIITFRVYD